MAPDPHKGNTLTADYQSETNSTQFSHKLAPIEDASTNQRVKYLGSLRSSVAILQEEINAYLTKKMEEENTKAAVDDKQEEENYGEEIVES
jgi:hypothetical protein